MLRKLRGFLLAVAIAGLVIDGSYYAYCHFAGDIASSKIVQQLGGE